MHISIKAILSDYDGVLIPDEYKGIKTLCADEDRIVEMEEPYYTQKDDTRLWEKMKEEFCLDQSITEIKNLYNTEDEIQERHAKEVLDIYGSFKKQGIRLLLLSNQVTNRSNYLRQKPSLQIFDKIYLSNEMGMKKPNPDIFLTVLSEQQLTPNETIFIDDQPENIDRANLLGFHSILFKTCSDTKNALERILNND